MDIHQERIGLEKKFFLLCDPVVQEAGYRLYDLEYITGQKLLRLFIQDPRTGSALIEDCVKVDHALSEPFEKEDWIPEEAYKVAHDFRNKCASNISKAMMNTLLTDLDKIWRAREKK